LLDRGSGQQEVSSFVRVETPCFAAFRRNVAE
jgi:hypothetical protein